MAEKVAVAPADPDDVFGPKMFPAAVVEQVLEHGDLTRAVDHQRDLEKRLKRFR